MPAQGPRRPHPTRGPTRALRRSTRARGRSPRRPAWSKVMVKSHGQKSACQSIATGWWSRCRAKRTEQLEGFKDVCLKHGSSQGPNLALTILYVPFWLDSGSAFTRVPRPAPRTTRGSYMGTSHIRKRLLLGAYSRALQYSWGNGAF